MIVNRAGQFQLNVHRQALPWDTDIDVQVSEASIHFLAEYYNMTTYHYKTPDLPHGRSYMLEINPNYVVRDGSDPLNSIDARWVDMETGLFIDVTAVRKNTIPDTPNVLTCKDGRTFPV